MISERTAPEEFKSAVRRNRAALRSAEASTPLLADYFKANGIFSKLDPEDPASVGAYNSAVELGELLGIFTEENLRRVIYMALGGTLDAE